MSENYLRKTIESVKYLIRDGFAHVFAGTILNKAIAMVSSIVIARIITKGEYAYINYADTIYGYLILFSGLGVATSILKVCSGKESGEYDRAYFNYALKFGLVFEVIATILLCAVCVNLQLPFPEAKEYILLLVLYPCLVFVADVVFCFVRAKQKSKIYAKINLLQAIMLCLLSIFLASIMGAKGMIFARYCALGVAIILAIRHISPGLKLCKQIKLEHNKKKAFLWMSLSLVLANAFSGMMPYNENLLVSNIIANEEISANFRVAGLFPQLLLLVTQAVNVYFFPIISEMDNKGKDTRKTVLYIGLFNLAIVCVCVLFGMIMTPWLITFFYGNKYKDAVEISYLLWIMRGLNAGLRIVPMNMIVAVGKYKFNLVMSIIACGFQIICDWYCISKYGIKGVAYGTIIVYAVTGILFWIYFFMNASKKERKNE